MPSPTSPRPTPPGFWTVFLGLPQDFERCDNASDTWTQASSIEDSIANVPDHNQSSTSNNFDGSKGRHHENNHYRRLKSYWQWLTRSTATTKMTGRRGCVWDNLPCSTNNHDDHGTVNGIDPDDPYIVEADEDCVDHKSMMLLAEDALYFSDDDQYLSDSGSGRSQDRYPDKNNADSECNAHYRDVLQIPCCGAISSQPE